MSYCCCCCFTFPQIRRVEEKHFSFFKSYNEWDNFLYYILSHRIFKPGCRLFDAWKIVYWLFERMYKYISVRNKYLLVENPFFFFLKSSIVSLAMLIYRKRCWMDRDWTRKWWWKKIRFGQIKHQNAWGGNDDGGAEVSKPYIHLISLPDYFLVFCFVLFFYS